MNKKPGSPVPLLFIFLLGLGGIAINVTYLLAPQLPKVAWFQEWWSVLLFVDVCFTTFFFFVGTYLFLRGHSERTVPEFYSTLLRATCILCIMANGGVTAAFILTMGMMTDHVLGFANRHPNRVKDH